MPLDLLHLSKHQQLAPHIGKAVSTTALGITDWNNLVTPGHCSQLMLGSLANGPGEALYYYVEVRTYGAVPEITQIGHQYSHAIARPMMIQRDRISGVWSAWRRVFDSIDKPAFMAGGMGAGTISGTNVKINYPTIQTNIGSHYNASNSRFTAPCPGNYFFATNALSQPLSPTEAEIQFAINGSYRGTGGYAYSTAADYNHVSTTIVLPMVTGDYVEVYSPKGSLHSSYRTLSGFLI